MIASMTPNICSALRKSLTSNLDVLRLARVGSSLIGAAETYPEAAAWITELLQPSDLADSLAGLMFGSAGVPAPPQVRTDHLLAGFVLARFWPDLAEAKHTAAGDGPPPLISDDHLYHVRPSGKRAAGTLAVGLVLWALPIALAAAAFGRDSVFVQQGLFFSGAAVVTFGGAYAVLSYVAQQAVNVYGWLARARW